MDATTTPLMPWLIQKLSAAHPTVVFEKSDHFAWSPSRRTIYYDPSPSLENDAPFLLLHELSHALLEHHTYRRDSELVAMESAAWERTVQYIADSHKWLASAPAKIPSLTMSDAVVQDHLDTYREWLHARSTCPVCSATGYQTKQYRYACPACSHQWRVNEARVCALRRYSISSSHKNTPVL